MPAARGKVTIHGLFDNGDVWATGFHVGELIGVTDGEGQAACTAIATHWEQEVWTDGALAPLLSDHTAWTGVTLADIRATNVTERTWSTSPLAPVYGTYGGNPLPNQLSSVVTLLTGYPGARNRGRMYFPAPGVIASSSTGKATPTYTGALVSALDAFFTDVNADPAGITACIYSPTQSMVREITAIRIGDVFDTQRRRRDTVPETFVSASI